jgi:hypothetical protein
MITSLARARAFAALLAIATFALGVVAGNWYAGRARPSVNDSSTATDRIPREIERLGITDAERAPIQAALWRGRDRVLRVRDELAVHMLIAVDSTEQEIRALLSPAQRASFDSARRVNGPLLQRKEVILFH